MLNYEIYPKYKKLYWSEEEIITFIKERAQEIGGNNLKQHDSILFIISGHGYNNAIISSDYQLIDKTAIHRLFSANYPSTRELPRIFMYDCCDGDNDIVTSHLGYWTDDVKPLYI